MYGVINDVPNTLSHSNSNPSDLSLVYLLIPDAKGGNIGGYHKEL